MKASSAPWSLRVLAMPQAMEWSLATPITRPRFPCISPVATIPEVLAAELLFNRAVQGRPHAQWPSFVLPMRTTRAIIAGKLGLKRKAEWPPRRHYATCRTAIRHPPRRVSGDTPVTDRHAS
ncbi:hypothetical protein CHELA17_63984 [Chelatococcus asaccharovorans]|nr:hypothetical protein CHELA17_63984 [Chelatococcus asaccharovorans]